MKTGTKIIVTNSPYLDSVPNGSIVTVTHVYAFGSIRATVDGGDGDAWYMRAGTFKEYTPSVGATETLEELNVRPGDVVEYAGNRQYTVLADRKLLTEEGDQIHYRYQWKNAPHFTIISRATPDLPHGHVTLSDGRTVDLTANRVRCDLMDPDELQALKDHGGPWEVCGVDGWVLMPFYPSWDYDSTYRVAPKPVVETVVMYASDKFKGFGLTMGRKSKHKLTITIQDGKIIDTKTEEL